MTEIVKSAMVSYSAENMLNLVNDVESYPTFLKWCKKGYIQSRDGDNYSAGILINIKGIQVEFQTSNEVIVEAKSVVLNMSLVKGPFKQLQGYWRFKNIEDLGSQVSLNLKYEIKSQVLGRVFAKGFDQVAERLVNDFVKRAGQLYG